MKTDINYYEFYKASYEYLRTNLPDGLSEEQLAKYFVGDRKDFNSIVDIFEQLIHSAQNYQAMPNAIKLNERKDEIKSILCDFDINKIPLLDTEELYHELKNRFSMDSQDSNYNSWHKWSKSVIQSAIFLIEFKDVEDFKNFVDRFDYNVATRMALPLLISEKISGIGFALACDFLKELGYTNYPKPDKHMIDIFNGLGLTDRNKISVFEEIVKMSDICLLQDESATPYKIDKILWLICSGKFYLNEVSTKSHKKDFISYINDNYRIDKNF